MEGTGEARSAYKMKSMKAKAKGKKPNGKFGKVKFPAKEAAQRGPDLSQLRVPIDTSLSTLYRVTKILENGSDEVRSILAYECDVVYECRICRSLFRSLVNFISHKRVYCKEKFNVVFAKNSSDPCNTRSTVKSDIQSLERKFEEACENDRISMSQGGIEELKKDLTTVVSMLQKKQEESLQSKSERLYLETVHTNPSAVYQTVESAHCNDTPTELMMAQVTELTDMRNGTAVLGPNGQLSQASLESSNDTGSEHCTEGEADRSSETELACSICSAKFSTKKTLTVHSRTLHTSHRLCYPCPCCSTTFANTWSVYRHLFKVHRKSNEEVRKLRSEIQEKAFIKDTTAAEDLQKEDADKALMNNALRVNETQEWIDHLECDSELQRCGGCGKRFDRKAALSAHSQYCHRRVAACENTSKATRKVSKAAQEDSASNENSSVDSEAQKNPPRRSPLACSELLNDNESVTSIRVEAVASLSKEDWDMMEGGAEITPEVHLNGNRARDQNDTEETLPRDNVPAKDNSNVPSEANDTSDRLEIVYTSISKAKANVGSRKRKNKHATQRVNSNSSSSAGIATKDAPTEANSDRDREEAEKLNRVLLMEKKVASIVNREKLQCVPCNRKFTSINNLRKHAAIHIGWNRYRCKLCDYKCFVKCDCVAHCNKIHNAQNNRVVIDEMILQIPDYQYTCERNLEPFKIISTLNTFEETESMEGTEVVEVPLERLQPEVLLEEVQEETEAESEAQTQIETQMESETQAQTEMETEAEAEAEAETQTETETETVTGTQKDRNTIDQEEGAKIIAEALNNNYKSQNATGLDPDLRRMVMEVIFGSSEIDAANQDDSSDSRSKSQQSKEQQQQEDSKESSKPQRPIRNKIKPLNKDFIYDLKEVTTARKDPPMNVKPYRSKKSPHEDEDKEEKDLEQQPSSKRFKPVQSEDLSIVCENDITDKCNIDLDRGLKSISVSFSQCQS